MRKKFYHILCVLLAVFAAVNVSFADYKIKQRMTMQGQTMESTIYVKGSRQRSQSSGYMGMGADVATIEQCDMKRDVQINDNKKLYFIEPFATDDLTSTTPTSTAATNQRVVRGGVVTMIYNITDTGERKQMFGLTARHLKTTMTMQASPDACTKGDMKIETDGWYVDLPQFSCPIQMPRNMMGGMGGETGGCQDRYVSKQTGSGKLGFALTETRTMSGMGGSDMTFTQSTETLEFSNAALDAGLFDIPQGYKLAASSQDLYGKPDIAAIMRQAENNDRDNGDSMKSAKSSSTASSMSKKPGMIRIGVMMPTNKTSESISTEDVRSDLVSKLTSGNVEAVEIDSIGAAQSINCDYVLSIDITKMKQSAASKFGGMFSKATGVDTSGAQKYEAQIDYRLMSADGSQTILQNQVTKKDSGTAETIAETALGQAVSAITGAASQKK